MKTGYAAGAVAGFIVGIPAAIFGLFIMGLYEGLSAPAILQLFAAMSIVHIGFNTIWGVIFGILFAKFYDVIPGASGVKKGLMFGVIYALVEWWGGSQNLVYGIFDMALLWAVYGPVVIFFYGLPLGYLYEGTQQPVKAEDKRKHKPVAGVIAGLVGGITAAVLTFIRLTTGIQNFGQMGNITPLITNVVEIEFILAFIWGIIFNIIFVLLYARIPGKDVMKGLYYGLILFLIISIYHSSVPLTAMSHMTGFLQTYLMYNITYGLSFISYGIILGYFYKK